MEEKPKILITGYEIKEDIKYNQQNSQLTVELTFITNNAMPNKYHEFLLKLNEFLNKNYNELA